MNLTSNKPEQATNIPQRQLIGFTSLLTIIYVYGYI